MAQTSPSPFSIHGLTLDAAYQKLDEEIAGLQSRLISLRTLRNSLAPICKIPIELLSKIFTHTLEHNDTTSSNPVDQRTRFVVSWVCRHRRDIALASPELWMTISIENPMSLELLRTLLTRSRSMELSLCLHKPSQDMVETCVSHIPRVRNLRLSKLPNCTEVEKLLDQPAPLLETLKLFNFRLSSTPTFSGVYPHLQRLMLLSVHFSTRSPLITPIITTLWIDRPPSPIGIDHLMDILPSLSCLTRLVLNQCFGDEEIVPSTPRIRLPTLQVLDLTERETHTVFNVLKSLDIPQAAITVAWPGDFGREMTDANMETFWFEIDLFLRHLRIPLPIRHLDINRNHPHYSVDISSSPSHHRYSFQFLGQELDHHATIRWVNSVIPLDDIETLVINDLPDATLESISGLTNLKTITVSGIAAWTLIAVLADTFFPALKELTICDINLADEDMPALDDILILHEDAGFGLDKLVFVGCNNVDMEIFEDLANIVELVDELDI